MKKRLVSLLLAFSMVLTFIPFSAISAFAADPWETKFTLNGVVYQIIPGSSVDVVGCASGATSIKLVTYPSYNGTTYRINSVVNGAFKDCTTLEKVDLSGLSDTPSWGTELFKGCTSLKEVNLGYYMTRIPARAFQDCTALEDLSFLKNVTSIGESAFEGCSSLTNVDLFSVGNTDKLTAIGARAFANCEKLTYAVLVQIDNKKEMTLGDNIFADCDNFQYATFVGMNKNQWNNPNAVPEDKLTYIVGNTAYFKTFTFVNGETQTKQNVRYSYSGVVGHVAKPVDPVKEGYTFTGWYTSADTQNQNENTKFDFNMEVTQSTPDTTLYAGWHHKAELTTNIADSNLTVGEAREFTFGSIANDDVGTYVFATFDLDADTRAAIEKLEYQESDGTWHELTTNFYGPVNTGYPMSDATSHFKVTFKKAGTYNFTVSAKKVVDGQPSTNPEDVLATKTVTVVVDSRTQNVNLTGDDVILTVDGKDAPVENGKVSISVSDLDKGTEVTVTAKNTQYDDSYQWTKDDEVVKDATGKSYTFTVTDKDVNLALKITRHSYAEDDFDITIPTGFEEGDGLSHAVTITAKEGHDVGEFTWKYVAEDDTVVDAPAAPERAGSYKVYIVRDGKDIFAGTLVIGAKRYELTVIGGTITLGDKEPEDAVVSGNKMTATIPEGAIVTVTFDDSILKDSGSVFDQWKITSKEKLLVPDTDDITVNVKDTAIKFVMPKGGVEIEAMTKDATIEDDSSEALGIAAAVVTGAVGTAVLTYQGYMLGTELYLTYLLPAGAAIPANRAQLAELVWQNAGKPEPAAPVALDAADDVKALTWAVETGLMDAANKNGEALAADASVSRIEVIKTWKKSQELKKNA